MKDKEEKVEGCREPQEKNKNIFSIWRVLLKFLTKMNYFDQLLPHNSELLSLLYNELYVGHFALLFCCVQSQLSVILLPAGMIWRTENIPASGLVEDFTAPVKMIYWGQDDLSRGYVTQEWLLYTQRRKKQTTSGISTQKWSPFKLDFIDLIGGNLDVNIIAYVFIS